MKLLANEIKNRSILNLDGQFWVVINFLHIKPGKGNAFIRTKIQNLTSGITIERIFKPEQRIKFIKVKKQNYLYLYKNKDNFVFMNIDNFEHLYINSKLLGNKSNYLINNQKIVISLYNNIPVQIHFPDVVIIKVIDTEPGIQKSRIDMVTKKAITETGYVLKVPLFIKNNDLIKVNVNNGKYICRMKKN